MATINVTIRMDKNDKQAADELFNEFGMSLTTAFNIFVKQALREQRIPFEISKKSAINYPSVEEVDKILDKEYEKHAAVYKELAK